MNISALIKWTSADFRFYGSLNDFLPDELKYRTFRHTVKGRPAVKDTLEALGIPHPEIDGIVVNGKSVNFSYQLREQDRIRVYPYRYKGRSKWKIHLVPRWPSPPRFVCDSHLGKLVRHLRLLGFDTIYQTVFPDQDIIRIGVKEDRMILTRDKGLLKNKTVRYGYWVRSVYPQKRLIEVLTRFRLWSKIRPFTLCLDCNGRIKRVPKQRIKDRLPPLVRSHYRFFCMCGACHKIYWKGSHHHKMMQLINKVHKVRRSKTPK